MLKIKAMRWGYRDGRDGVRIEETWLISPSAITAIHFVEATNYSDGKPMNAPHVQVHVAGRIRGVSSSDGGDITSDPIRVEDADSITRLMKLEEATADNNFGM